MIDKGGPRSSKTGSQSASENSTVGKTFAKELSFREKENDYDSAMMTEKVGSNARTTKAPLNRKSSNISSDAPHTKDDPTDEMHVDEPHDESRKQSLTVGDFTGHLGEPSLAGNLWTPNDLRTNISEIEVTSSMEVSSSGVHSPVTVECSSFGDNGIKHTRRTPHIIYSKSEDRAAFPAMPYTGHGSPMGAARLRHQPTLETRRVSLTAVVDGYMQLNQYQLQDEIGKVRNVGFNVHIKRQGHFHYHFVFL